MSGEKREKVAITVAIISVLISLLTVIACLVVFVWKPFDKDDETSRERTRASERNTESSSKEVDVALAEEDTESEEEPTASPSVDKGIVTIDKTNGPGEERDVYSDRPEDVMYIFFHAFLYGDVDTAYDCFAPFSRPDYEELSDGIESYSDLKDTLEYETTAYHLYNDDEINDLITTIATERGYVANEIKEAAVLYTHYKTDSNELDDEMIVVRISGRWYIYDYGNVFGGRPVDEN